MKLQLNITKVIEKIDDLDFLTGMQKSQLSLALDRYFGNNNSSLQDLFSRNACVTVFIQIVDTRSLDKPLYDFWEINFDSGTLFFPNSLELAGLKKIQNSFCLDDGFASPDLQELADQLNIAKKVRLPEPIRVELNKDDEIIVFKDLRDLPQKAANWTKFLGEHKLSQELVEQYHSMFNDASWKLILTRTKLSEAFLEALATEIGWKLVSDYQYLNEEFIQKHQDSLDWKVMSHKQKFNESQLIRYQDKLDWHTVSWAQTLSPDLINRLSDRLNWESICISQKLDAETIKTHIDKINNNAWKDISNRQILSPELLALFFDKIDWKYASMNIHLTDDQLVQFGDKIVWNRLINYGRNLSFPFILNLIDNNLLAFEDLEDIINERKKFELSDEQVKELKKTIKLLKKKIQ